MQSFGGVIGRLTSISAVVTVAVMPIDVFDLAKGKLPFSVTPNLVCFLCFLFFLVLETALRTKLRLRRDQISFLGAVLLFWVIAGVSLFLADKDYLNVGPQRFVLLLIVISEAVLIVLWTLDNGHEELVFGQAAFVSLCLIAGFMVLQLLHLYLDYSPATSLLTLVSSLDISKIDITQAGCLPMGGWYWWRPFGLVGDPNRAAVSCLVMGTLAFVFLRRPLMKVMALIIALFAVFATLSRSAFLFLLPLPIVGFIVRRSHKSMKSGFTLAALVCLAGLLWLSLTYYDELSQSRLSTDDYSTATHLALIERAVSITLDSSVKHFVIGVGWGSEYAFCDDFFPYAGKFANFHSNIFSIMVQTGFLGFILWAWFSVVVPVSKGLKATRGIHSLLYALALSYLFAGVFYQFYFELSYWLSIALAALYYARQTPDASIRAQSLGT